ncbi:MAG: phosphoheptose isomerase, partial [Acidimicrobiia bacterium]
EPLSFFRYFWDKVSAAGGEPGRHFAVITDPGTPLVDLAEERGFRRVFEAPPDVGGRYSALTVFGLVPAALIGVDVDKLLDRAWTMAEAAAFCVAEPDNPALGLGAALGELARNGKDKATFLVSSSLAAFPGWAEQLIAESTGKDGTGILPVADEPAGPPEVYGPDRFFVYLWHGADDDSEQRQRIEALEAVGHPVARIRLDLTEDLGQEMFRSEVAVAAAGAVLGIHPFNQPDVQLAKDLARQAMTGELDGGAAVEETRVDDSDALASAVREWVDTARPGDYGALQAYLAPTAETTQVLQRIRLGLRDRLRVATTLGYGPRFLHSTGQLHKGGPPTGLFLQLVDEPARDLDVPETDYSFGKLIEAQALGDFQALQQRERRVLRVRLGSDVVAGLGQLGGVFDG